jgi:cellobiose phosphorylase
MQLFNGIGGFSTDGREYVIAPIDDQPTPAPWCNVLANPRFGSVVSDTGSAYTWCENAHGLRLTPWHNDPVTDDAGEAIFLRDEDNGYSWSPTTTPRAGRAGAARPVTRHGFGYSVFQHVEDGMESELTVFVAIDAPLKFSRLRLRNRSGRTRRLSAFGYVEWVLGDRRTHASMHVVTEIDRGSGAVLARNRYHPEFGAWVAFFDIAEPPRSVTGDRTEFIGRHRSLRAPAALERSRLSGKVGAGLDPCAAIQAQFELADGEEREIVFRLGAAQGLEEARDLLQRFAMPDAVDEALVAVERYWARTLGTVQVKTPEPALDLLVNGWLVYQTLSCRYWARSGYYQSSGAYGFRDQLQDTMALLHAEPKLLREHLLRSAARQFIEGDVQHWWHPPTGRGVRTRCSDDYLWLPLALCRYLEGTGDESVLEEVVPFLEGPPVPPGEESYFDVPTLSSQSASLYQHAVRAIEHGFRFGAHGLPLMGGGDWNDGMNLVGIEGRGESV